MAGEARTKYIIREIKTMKITRKDIMRAVSESIKGFKPDSMTTSGPKPMDNAPSQPVDYDKVAGSRRSWKW